MLSILFVPLKLIGDGFSFKEMMIIFWGGLRGALSLALVLIIQVTPIENEDAAFNSKTKNLALFHVIMQVCMTLMINGTTCGWVLKKTQIIENNNVKLNFKRLFLMKTKMIGNEKFSDIKHDEYFDLAEWMGVEKLINLDGLANEHDKITD